MSPREQIQKKLVKFLNDNNRNKWSAPYGVLEGMDTLPKGGKVRTITFGVARYLDATIYIWSAKKIIIEGSGPLSWKYTGEFKGIEEVIKCLSDD